MKTFLQYAAEDIYQKHQDHLSQVSIVFPNNRAKIFFIEHLYNAAGHPLWAPQFIPVNHLFTQHSDLMIADPILLNSILYKVYQEVMNDGESFDEFYGWGNVLLNDFDNVDKNCVDARQLFRNISEQGEYSDTFEHLSEDQIQTIQLFFEHFKTGRTELKKRFIHTWNQLFRIYTEFRERLQKEHLAYEGMLNRLVVENLEEGKIDSFEGDLYAFVGFNALNVCEQKLFKKLQQSGKAVFYWDYDTFYLNNLSHEAGRFIRENLQQFPNELDKNCFDNFRSIPKHIQLIASPSEYAQTHYAGTWLNEVVSLSSAEETAMVLCNEKLLLPALHCIPENITELNITMGYPLTQTPVFNLIRQLVLLHTEGYRNGCFRSKFALPVLQNNYIRNVCPWAKNVEQYLLNNNRFNLSLNEFQQVYTDSREETPQDVLTLAFQPRENAFELGKMLLEIIQLLAAHEGQILSEHSDNSQRNEEIFQPMYPESLFQSYITVNRLNDLLGTYDFEINLHTYRNLLFKVLNISIPFSGEPLHGVQIMGILETRNLDFKNVLMLSANEGMLPKSPTDTSFIPYNLRKAFHMTGPEHQDAISAYYFFRFLQRAQRITLVYNSTTDGLNKGEMSRFLLQLKMESGFPIQTSSLTAPICPSPKQALVIPKSNEIMEGLPTKLSPSNINDYLDCSLRFYFKFILHLEEEKEVIEEIDSITFGNIFHHSAEYLYTGILLNKNHLPCSHKEIIRVINQKGLLNTWLQRDDFSGLIDRQDLEHFPWDNYVESIVDEFFRRDFFKNADLEAETISPRSLKDYNGEQLIQRKLLIQFLKYLIRIDKQYAPFEIIGLEKSILSSLNLSIQDKDIFLRGIIDRIDKKGSVIRILDYKTGGKPVEPNNIEDLFDGGAKRAHYILQTFLYAGAIQRSLQTDGYDPKTKVKPELLYIHLAGEKSYSSSIQLEKSEVYDIRGYVEEFQSKLHEQLTNLYNQDLPFTQTNHIDNCRYCDFQRICGRN